MFITGMDDPNNLLTPIKQALKDDKRIRYHNDYLTNLLAAIKYVILFQIYVYLYLQFSVFSDF